MSSSLTPGVWECKNCYTRNVRKLERCSRCDCVNPLMLSPLQASSVRSPAYPVLDRSTRADSVGRQLLPSTQSPSPTGRQQHTGVVASPHRSSPTRDIGGFSAPPSRDLLLSPSTVYQGRASRSPPSAAFTAYSAQQNAALQSQLTQAIASHRSLMREYTELNQLCDRNEETIDRLRKDLVALDAVYRTAKRDAEVARATNDTNGAAFAEDYGKLEQRCERLEREVAEREQLWREKSSLVESIQREKDAAVQELRDVLVKERVEWNDRIHQLEGDLRNLQADYRAQQSQHSVSTAELQRLFASEREQFAANSQALLRELSTTHQASLAKVSEEVMHTKELSSMLAKKEREMLLERAEHEQQMRIDADRRRERDTSDAKLELERTRESLDIVTKQRDELLSEAKFQLEIVSELRTEKAACKAELSALRVQLSSPHPVPHGAFSGLLSAVNGTTPPSTLHAPTRSATTSPIPTPLPTADQDAHRRLQQQLVDATADLEEAHRHSAMLEASLAQLRSDMLEEKDRYHSGIEIQREAHAAECLRLRQALDAATTTPAQGAEEVVALREEVARLTDTVAELQRSLAAVRNDFADEVAAHESSKVHHDDQERKLQQKLSTVNHRVEQLQYNLADQQSENAKLVEECEALRVAMGDMEQSFADALAAASPQ